MSDRSQEVYNNYTIADGVFGLFPGYLRGAVLAFDVSNGESQQELVQLLRAEEASVRKRLILE